MEAISNEQKGFSIGSSMQDNYVFVPTKTGDTVPVGIVTTPSIPNSNIYPTQLPAPCPTCGSCPTCGRKSVPQFPQFSPQFYCDRNI